MGFAHPDHLLKQLSSPQLSEWEAYDRLEPVGRWGSDYRGAALLSLMTNVHLKKGSPLTKPQDFMPDWNLKKGISQGHQPDVIRSLSMHGWVEHPIQTSEQMKHVALSIAKRQNKQVEKEHKLKNTPPKNKRQ